MGIYAFCATRLRPNPYETNNTMIELRHISKWHMQGGKPVFILKDINVKIIEGEFVLVMGPSGSGKSTLLHVEEVNKLKEKQRSKIYKQNIGFVFRTYHLIDELTVYENI